MATYDKGKCITLIAGQDLTGKMYHAIKLNTDSEAVLAGAGEAIVGILQDEATENKAVPVMINGTSAVIAGEIIGAGVPVAVNAAGRIVAATSETNAIGTTLEASGAAGEVIEILVGIIGCKSAVAHPVSIINLPVTLSGADNNTLMNGFVPGFAGTIKSMHFVTTTAATTADKTCTVSAKIGSTSVTGGSLVLTTANCDTIGEKVDATAITAANAFTATDAISIVVADTAAPFTEGAGNLIIVLQQ